MKYFILRTHTNAHKYSRPSVSILRPQFSDYFETRIAALEFIGEHFIKYKTKLEDYILIEGIQCAMSLDLFKHFLDENDEETQTILDKHYKKAKPTFETSYDF